MKKLQFLNDVVIIILFSVSATVFGQNVPIDDLVNTYPNITFNSSDFNLLKTGSDNLRGQKKILLSNTAPRLVELQNESWPDGAWGRGYYSGNNASFLDVPAKVFANENRYWGCYPLPRDISKFSRGHLQLFKYNNDIAQIDFVEDGLDYLLNVQNNQGGGFIFHHYRKSRYDASDHPSNNQNAYTTAFALRSLSEYYLSNHNYKRNQVLNAIKDASAWLIDSSNLSQSTSNANARGLTIWALSAAYKATKDCSYLPIIFELTQQLIELQDKNSSHTNGVWFTGGPDDVGNLQLWHDTKIQYHMLTLRGLVEAFDVTPNEYTLFKHELVNTINRAINHLVNYRINESDPTKKIFKQWFSENSFENNGVLNLSDNYIFSATNTVDEAGTFLEPLLLLSLYAKNSSYYSSQDQNRLRNITNCIAQNLSANQPYHIDGIGYYVNYTTAMDNNADVFPWARPQYENTGYNAVETTYKTVSGDFDNDGYKDDLAAFYYLGNGLTKLDVWKSDSEQFDYEGSNGWWQSPSWYNSNNISSRVVVGDFDGDGYEDDIAGFYKLGAYQTTIHVWVSNGSGFTYAGSNGWWNTSGYSSDLISGRVVSGDFNGDGKDDIGAFYSSGNYQTTLHVWVSNGIQFLYSGSNGWWNTSGYDANQISGRVISGDFNGNGKDDIAAFYDYGSNQTRIHVWKSNGNQFNYVGSNGWWKTFGYDANKITGRVVSGNFYNDNQNREEIVAFYDNGNNSTNIHLWKYNGTDFSYDKGSQGWWSSLGYDANKITGRVLSGNFNNSDTDDIAGLVELSEYDAKIHIWKSDLGTTEFKFTGPNGWWNTCSSSIGLSFDTKNLFVEGKNVILKADKGVRLFPIPSNGLLNLSVTENEFIEKIIVHDLTGKQVYNSSNHLGNYATFQLNGELSGIFIVTVITNENVYQRKIVINK